MQTIFTRYYGPTNFHGSCIRAWSSGNPAKRIRKSYDHSLNADLNHRATFLLLAKELGWQGTWASGSAGNSLEVFVPIAWGENKRQLDNIIEVL